jgi:hypothetical protein
MAAVEWHISAKARQAERPIEMAELTRSRHSAIIGESTKAS